MGLVTELRHYYEVIRARIWVVAVVVVLAVGGTVFHLANQPPKYEAKASVLITPRVIAPTAFDDAGISAQSTYFQLGSAYDETIVNNTIQLLKSRELRRRVAARVGLNASRIPERVRTREVVGTHFLVIAATDENPAQAAAIANTTAEEFSNFYAELNRADANRTRAFLEEQLSLAERRLAAAEGALRAFRSHSGSVAPSEEISRAVQRLVDLQAAYDAARLEETVARTRVAAIQSQLHPQNGERLASISIATNPIIAQIRDHLTGLELELVKLRQMYTDQHPKVQGILSQIVADRRRLRSEADKVLADQSLGSSPVREQFIREMVNAEVDSATARAKMAGIMPILAKVQTKLTSVANDEVTLGRHQRDVKIAEQLYTRLSAMHQDAVIRQSKASSSGHGAIVVVDHATVPDQPVPSPLPKTAAVAGLLGLFVGAGLALVGESFDERIRSSPQAEAAYGVPVLASVPTMNARSYRHLTTAPTVAGILLPIILVLAMLGGGAAGAYVVQAKATPSSVAHFTQAVRQAFHTIR